MSRNVIIAIVAVLAVIIVGWFLTRPKPTVAPTTIEETPASTESASPSATDSAMMEENTVAISAQGFSPQAITVKVGQTVMWTNDDTAAHTVNSDPHPTHTLFAPLNLGSIQPGTSKSLTFDKAGVYKYHDHLNPSLTGTITVQ